LLWAQMGPAIMNKQNDDVSTLLLTDEKIFTVVTLKNQKNHQLYATVATKKKCRDKTLAHINIVQTVTDGISWRVTSGRENASLIRVFHRTKVIEGCYHNVMLL